MNVEEEIVKTDLDILNERIAKLEGSKLLWDRYALQQLKAERDKWYAEDGSAIPVTPEVPEYAQHSPAEVVGAEGWWVTMPALLREPPYWVERAKPEQGLEISVSRSNGCFLVRKEVECAEAWINDTAAEAERLGASARLLYLAGHMMRGNRYLLPTQVIGHGEWQLGNYALQPEVPFNAWEKERFKTLFSEKHFIGAYAVGSKLMTHGAGFPRHFIPTVMNRPDMGVVALMEWFNTGWFRDKYYRIARSQARAIDIGKMGRVEGYTAPEAWGGENTPEWRNKFEPTRSDKMPGLWTLGPDGLAR